MNKKKLIILSITLIMLILTVGIAYAYFSASYIENTQEEMLVSGDIVLRIDDVNIVTNENMIPGDYIEKQFTVTNTSDKDTTYDLWLSDVLNGFNYSNEFIYNLISDDGGRNITGYYNYLPKTNTKIVNSYLIRGNTTHTYTLKITYKDVSSGNDINNMGKTFSAKIKINEEKKYAKISASQTFIKNIKSLANPDVTNITYSYKDYNITGFQKANELDTTKNYINLASDTSLPIYAWYDNGIIYYYYEGERIYFFATDSLLYYLLGITEFTWPSDWDTTYSTNMEGMFAHMENCVTLDLTGINTSNITSMSNMFSYMNKLTSLDLSKLDTSNVTNMQYMFWNCLVLDDIDFSKIDTSKVTRMNSMFSRANKITDDDLRKMDTSKVTDMSSMFEYSTNSASFSFEGIDTRSVTDMSAMFKSTSFSSINLTGINTSNVTNMNSMFNSSKITTIDLSPLDTSSVTNMNYMFRDSNLITIDLSPLDTSKVTSMDYMFYYCSYLTSITFGGKFNTSNVTSMKSMFFDTYRITTLDVSSFNTSNVTNMSGMFANMNNLTDLNITNFNTEKVTDMSGMFAKSKSLTSLDLSSFKTSALTKTQGTDISANNIKYKYGMFQDMDALTTIYIDPNKWDMSNVTSSENMFLNTTNIKGGNNTVYDADHIDVSYAHVDVAGDPGYLTLKV